MEVPASHIFLLLLLGACGRVPGSAFSEAPPLVNEDVKRTVDLSSHLAKVTAEVVLVHAGGGSTSRATSFLLALEPELEARLAYLGVQVSAGSFPPSSPEAQGLGSLLRPRREYGASGRQGWRSRSEPQVSFRLGVGWSSTPNLRRAGDTSAHYRSAFFSPATWAPPRDPPIPRGDLRPLWDVARAAWYPDLHAFVQRDARPHR